jgi:23S rRNA pseudouridine2605 synthase
MAPASTDPTERLQKVLARSGVGSRRFCESVIAEGRVRVNGRVVERPGTKVDPEKDEISVDGDPIRVERSLYFLLNKPKGVVCTNRPRSDEIAAAALVPAPAGERLFCVGRLDQDSEGALIVTNDGAFCNLVTHPRYGVAKTYLVRVRGRVEPGHVEALRRGVHLAEGRTAPPKIHVVKRGREASLLRLTLREGKNRHLRRILARVGLLVTDLVRLEIGEVRLGKLRSGESRNLSPEEVVALRHEASRPGAASRKVAPRRRRSDRP